MLEKPSEEELQRLQNHRYKIYKKYYEKWQNNPVLCPFLECEVTATRTGWEHIAGLSKFRSIEDTHRRLDLFKYARDIVEKSGTCQYIRYQNGEIHYTFQGVVQFKGEYDSSKKYKLVRVVVIKKNSGVAVFHSVMDE